MSGGGGVNNTSTKSVWASTAVEVNAETLMGHVLKCWNSKYGLSEELSG